MPIIYDPHMVMTFSPECLAYRHQVFRFTTPTAMVVQTQLASDLSGTLGQWNHRILSGPDFFFLGA